MIKITDGSEKQNAWAEKIRGEFLAGIEAQIGFARERSKPWTRNVDRATIATFVTARELATTQISAKWWIDNRSRLIPAALRNITAETVTAKAREAFAEAQTEGEDVDATDAAAKVITALVYDRGSFDRTTITFTF